MVISDLRTDVSEARYVMSMTECVICSAGSLDFWEMMRHFKVVGEYLSTWFIKIINFVCF